MTRADTVIDALRAMPKAWRQDVPQRLRAGSGSLHLEVTGFDALHEEAVRVDVRLMNRGVLVFDDRVNLVRSPLLVPDPSGAAGFVLDPGEALRQSLMQTIFNVTGGLKRPRLERVGRSDQFRGDTTSVRAGTNDGSITSINTVWNTARDGSGSLTVDTTALTESMLVAFSSPNYLIHQYYAEFDTSAIPDADDVSAYTFTLYTDGIAASNPDSTTLDLRAKDWGGGTLTTADWVDLNPGTDWTSLVQLATKALSTWGGSADTPNALTSTGATDSINKAGMTRVGLTIDRGYSATAPTGTNRVQFRTADQTGTTSDPLLDVTHTPTTAPQYTTFIRPQAVKRAATR